MLLPAHQPCTFLKYHGCSNYRKYMQKRLFNLGPVKHEKLSQTILQYNYFNSKFMYELEIMGQRPETGKPISDRRPLISPTNQPNQIL